MFIGASLVCQSDTGFRSSNKGGIPTIHSTLGPIIRTCLLQACVSSIYKCVFITKEIESREPLAKLWHLEESCSVVTQSRQEIAALLHGQNSNYARECVNADVDPRYQYLERLLHARRYTVIPLN